MAWTVVLDWSTATSAPWNTTGLPQNAYNLLVETRANDFAGAALASSRLSITLGGLCSPTTLTVTPSSPRALGTLLSLTAGATCVSGTPEFRFDYLPPGSTVYTQLRTWGGATATLDTT